MEERQLDPRRIAGNRAGHPLAFRVVAWLIVALTVLLFFEASIHSVHHVGDEREASECVVVAAVGHLAGIAPETPAVDSPFVMVAALDVANPVAAAPIQLLNVPFGRAPPSASLI